jgi:DNA-binding beta-propeller fold protein YncE
VQLRSMLTFTLSLCSLPGYSQMANTAISSQPLHLEQSISLPSTIIGAFDHFGVDLKHHRLFATAENSRAVLVIDLETGKLVQQIGGIGKPHAVFYQEDRNRIYVTDGVDALVRVYDGDTYKPLDSISLLKDADSIGYDPSRQYLYVVNGGGDAGQKYSMLGVLDTASDRKVTDIRIDGETLEAMSLDRFRPRLYVNNRATNHVVVVDRLKNAVVADWPVMLGKTNVAMALDEQRQRLFVGCRSGQMVIFDTNTGKELQALAITKGVDDIIYDPASKRVYASGGGAVDSFQQVDADHYNALGSVPAGLQSKTARLVPEVNRLFVAVPKSASDSAQVFAFSQVGVPVYSDSEVEAAHVDAPLAEAIIVNTLSKYPYLRKLGLHAVPPGQNDSVIIANGDATRLGRKTTEADFAAVRAGKTSCAKRDDGSFYNLKLPIADVAGHPLVMLVMEIPYTSASDGADASRQAERIRDEVASQIPSLDALFKHPAQEPQH